MQGAWGTQTAAWLRPPLLRCLHDVSVSDCYFLVLQEPMEWQGPVLIKDHHNDDYCWNDKAVGYLVPSVLCTLILTEKVLSSSTLQMKKLKLRGLK